MKAKLDGAGVPTGESVSQVIPIMVRDDARVFQMGEALLRAGVFINPVKYPAVAKHKSRFRMSISAAHTETDLAEGADIIHGVLREYGVCP
jgi:glycine C-acetyltransferase